LLVGVRDATIDIDLKLDPEPDGVFESIADLKDRLSVNVELASPDDFLPALPGWSERSEWIVREGSVDFFHYDFYGQVLAKVLRGHSRDIDDAHALVVAGKVHPERLIDMFESIRPQMIRYPSIDPDEFASRLRNFLDDHV